LGDVLRELDVKQSASLCSDLAEMYLEQYCKVANRHWKTKKYRIELLMKRLGNIPVNQLSPTDLVLYVTWRKTHPEVKRLSKVSNATINKDIVIIKHMMAWAEENELIAENRIRRFKKLPELTIERQKPTDEIIDAVFAKLDELVRPVFVFIQETGVRRGEALGLTWDRVRIEDRKIVLNKTKAGNWRFAFLTDKSIEAIRANPRACEYVFYNPKTLTRWYDCKKYWEEARKDAGYPWLQVKDLRRAYGIKLAESDRVEMHHISKALGHSSVRVTEKYYAQFSEDESIKRVLKVMEGGRK